MQRGTVCFTLLKEATPLHTSVPLYQSVRHRSRFHQHIRYSWMPAPAKWATVDPKTLEPGKYATPSPALGDMVKAREFKFDVASMNARGFLRFQKPYQPPEDAAERILRLCVTHLNATEEGKELRKKSLGDAKSKFELLTKAHDEFKHAVPNSMLHMMNNIGNVVHFYCTPVKTLTPYEELIRSDDLPGNLHVQKEPVRFHPDTDQVFGGMTAYNKNATIVTGLRAKRKYRGYEPKMTWP